MSRVWKTIPLHNITSQLHWLACRINLFLQGNGVSMFKRGFKNAVPSMQCCFFFFLPRAESSRPAQEKRCRWSCDKHFPHNRPSLSSLYSLCLPFSSLFRRSTSLFTDGLTSLLSLHTCSVLYILTLGARALC